MGSATTPRSPTTRKAKTTLTSSTWRTPERLMSQRKFFSEFFFRLTMITEPFRCLYHAPLVCSWRNLSNLSSGYLVEHKTLALAINRDYFRTVFTSDHPCPEYIVYSQYTGGLWRNQHQKQKMARPINREGTYFML